MRGVEAAIGADAYATVTQEAMAQHMYQQQQAQGQGGLPPMPTRYTLLNSAEGDPEHPTAFQLNMVPAPSQQGLHTPHPQDPNFPKYAPTTEFIIDVLHSSPLDCIDGCLCAARQVSCSAE